jgi:coatomer subunit beta'
MKFEIKKKLVAKSVRVKSVDFHSSFPWVLIGLYTGSVTIYDYNTQASLQYLEVTSQPIRCAKFISEKNLYLYRNL